MKILITGASGQLGSEIQKIASQYPDFEFIFTDVQQLDITNQKEVFEFYEKHKYDFIVNCAAYTAVDKAETELELAQNVNVTGVANLAEISKQKNVPIIHVSTDYVYSGENFTPYVESDPTAPQSAYGKTKLDGELQVLELNNFMIIRTSWLYSTFGHNFVKTMLRLGKERDSLNVVFDQIGSPTYAHDLAKAILQILEQNKNGLQNFPSGVYNYSNEGVCSWYDFAYEIMRITKTDCKIFPIETKDYPTPAKRPSFSVLNKQKIKKTFNIEIPHWTESLKNCIKAM